MNGNGSLLDNAYEDFTIINKAIVDDGYGSQMAVWTDGATIPATAVYDGSTQMKIAQAAGSTSVYRLIVRKNVLLDYHTVLRRERDKKIFRITNDADENQTPSQAALNMRQYDAEEYDLPR